MYVWGAFLSKKKNQWLNQSVCKRKCRTQIIDLLKNKHKWTINKGKENCSLDKTKENDNSHVVEGALLEGTVIGVLEFCLVKNRKELRDKYVRINIAEKRKRK